MPTNKKTPASLRLHDRVRYSSMRPDQIDARKKKMREYNNARRNSVATTDDIMSDAQYVEMSSDMLCTTPNGSFQQLSASTPMLSGVATPDDFMHDAHYDPLTIALHPVQAQSHHSMQQGEAPKNLTTGIY